LIVGGGWTVLDEGMTAPAHGLVLWKVFYARKRRMNDRTECMSY
jgi:hypothetical protein